MFTSSDRTSRTKRSVTAKTRQGDLLSGPASEQRRINSSSSKIVLLDVSSFDKAFPAGGCRASIIKITTTKNGEGSKVE